MNLKTLFTFFFELFNEGKPLYMGHGPWTEGQREGVLVVYIWFLIRGPRVLCYFEDPIGLFPEKSVFEIFFVKIDVIDVMT